MAMVIAVCDLVVKKLLTCKFWIQLVIGKEER